MMKKKALSDNETLFRLDCRMALHQRLCWVILACFAAGCVWLMTVVQNSAFSDTVRTALLFAIMMGLVMAYRWSSAAPVRSLRKWGQRLERGNVEQYRELLNYVMELEKNLPDFMRRQLNHTMTGTKASLLAALGRKDEAVALLKNFDQYWDVSQRENFQKMIRKISGEETETEQKEN